MKLEVDNDNNVAYLQLGPDRGSVMQIPVAFPDAGEIIIDIDMDGKILGIEFLNAHGLIPEEEIRLVWLDHDVIQEQIAQKERDRVAREDGRGEEIT